MVNVRVSDYFLAAWTRRVDLSSLELLTGTSVSVRLDIQRDKLCLKLGLDILTKYS